MRLLLASLALVTLCGCTVLHSSPTAERMGCVPLCQSDVCTILVEATPDLGRWGKLPEINDYLQGQGVDTVYFNPYFDGLKAEDLAACIRYNRCVRGKRILLVAWSYATVQCLKAMDIVACEGIDIDTFIDIECLGLNVHYGFDLQPVNAHRTVVVRRNLSMLPIGYDNPVIVRVNHPRHLQAMCHTDTVDTIFREYYRLLRPVCPPAGPDVFTGGPPVESSPVNPPAPVEPGAPAPPPPQ